MTQSQVLVLYSDTAHRSIVPFIGPGRLVHKFNTYFGKKAEKFCSKLVIQLGLDPSALASRIENFFGSSLEERQSKLDLLYDDCDETEVNHLKKDCLKLLNGAWPQSSSETTQWDVFDTVIVLTTRYPGIRNLFCQHKDVPDPPDHVRISKNWLREGHTSGLEFDFYREFAAFCLHRNNVVEIVEGAKPSDLARIQCVAANADDESYQNYVPVEELLGYCRDGPDFSLERLLATRYLATTLRLPAFWLHDINRKRYTGILSNICKVVCQLIEDTDSNDSYAERKNVWIPIALNSIDEVVHALMIGVEPFMSKLVIPEPFMSRPPALTSLLSKFRKPDVVTRFPLSSPIALLMLLRLPSGSVSNADSDMTRAFEQASFVTQTDDARTEGSIDWHMESEDTDPSHGHDKNEKTPTRDLMFDEHGVLPSSFLLSDLAIVGTRPVYGGGFSDIWRGELDGRDVCIKVRRVFATIRTREELLKQFRREAIFWEQLKHPNILPFLGVNFDLFDPAPCFVSPWMENGNIMQVLQQNPTYDRMIAIRDVAEGLKYLHTLNPPVIHGDIRGANIYVTPDLRCCLADFGLAAVEDDDNGEDDGIRGTIRWMAPEALLPPSGDKSRNIAPFRDIYAFACTVLELCTGQVPFHEHRLDTTVIYRVLRGERPQRPSSDIWFPDKLWDLVQMCWTEDPATRPTATGLVELIGQIEKSLSEK